MWCPSCRADVAAELSSDNRRMLCARCQTELGITSTAASQIASLPRAMDTERDARELLARWSAQNLLDVPAPSVGAGAFAKPNGSVDLPLTRPDLRFDGPRSAAPAPTSPFLAAAIAKQSSSTVSITDSGNGASQQLDARRKKKSTSIPVEAAPTSENRGAEHPPADEHPAKQLPASTHSEDEHHLLHEGTYLHDRSHHKATWSMLAGQICAYAGVGLLSCGTVLVMWSYFGGPPKYLPTGWLTAAVGQMLLFLGVITLISSGMGQTVSEVGWRIDFLAEEVHHMENALAQLESEHKKARRRRHRNAQRRANEGPSRDAA